MDLTKKIARRIERELGYTNGWKIEEEKYDEHCLNIAKWVVGQLDALVILRPKDVASLQEILVNGSLLSNVAFNLKQRNDIPEDFRKDLGTAQANWDTAKSNGAEIYNKLHGAL